MITSQCVCYKLSNTIGLIYKLISIDKGINHVVIYKGINHVVLKISEMIQPIGYKILIGDVNNKQILFQPIKENRMKFVIKSGSTVKLYSGEMKIEALAQFLKENFANWNANNLYYLDSEGDHVVIRMQEDIDALLAINPLAQFLKLELVQDKHQEPQKEQTNTLQDQPKSTIGEQKISEPNYHKETSSSEDSGKSSEKRKFQMVEGLINQKVALMVDERIKSLIPCIKHQLSQEVIDSKVAKIEGTTKHEGVKCNGCGSEPITGIRYKCLECFAFNFCEKCEQNIEHHHNLLKMKKPEQEESTEKKKSQECFFRMGRKFFRQFRRGHSSSHSHEKGHSHWPGHWKGKGKCKFDNHLPSEHRIKRKEFKLQAVFGEQPDFKEFILKNSQLKAWQLIELYAAEKKISQEELQEKRNKMRKQKLSAFYECPESEFDEVVKNNPTLGFRELIVKLRQCGLRTYTGQNFKKMREKFRKERDEASLEKRGGWRQRRSHSKRRERKMDEKKCADKSLKKEIVKQMECLFGEERSREYKDFIKENGLLGKQEAIAKWLQKMTL